MSLRPRSVWRRTPLWLRLITTVLALSIVALTVMGVIGARLLRGYLVDRVDDQLVAAARAVQIRNGDVVLGRGTPTQYHFETQGVTGTVEDVYPSKLSSGPPPKLPTITPAEARERRGAPLTVPATRGNGSWRSPWRFRSRAQNATSAPCSSPPAFTTSMPPSTSSPRSTSSWVRR